ncbi:ABC transporter substrate-binding protein, partial [Acinetobacter baumannii]|uniref:ABC transporter substrate-binding protein n=1 Tax=Acinetobacter baumannii TaxID=470 RepID=UPI0018990EDD
MRPIKTILCGALFLAGSLAASTSLADTANGVTDDQITLGTLQDLSGPLAKYSQEALNGMLMAIDEVNEAGGIHGRELALEVADHGYQPQRAVLAARRMIQREHIFAMIQEMGSVTTMATRPILKQHNVLSLFPLSG